MIATPEVSGLTKVGGVGAVTFGGNSVIDGGTQIFRRDGGIDLIGEGADTYQRAIAGKVSEDWYLRSRIPIAVTGSAFQLASIGGYSKLMRLPHQQLPGATKVALGEAFATYKHNFASLKKVVQRNPGNTTPPLTTNETIGAIVSMDNGATAGYPIDVFTPSTIISEFHAGAQISPTGLYMPGLLAEGKGLQFLYKFQTIGYSDDFARMTERLAASNERLYVHLTDDAYRQVQATRYLGEGMPTLRQVFLPPFKEGRIWATPYTLEQLRANRLRMLLSGMDPKGLAAYQHTIVLTGEAAQAFRIAAGPRFSVNCIGWLKALAPQYQMRGQLRYLGGNMISSLEGARYFSFGQTMILRVGECERAIAWWAVIPVGADILLLKIAD